MMACARYDEDLTARADGALHGVGRLRLALHLLHCRGCAESLRRRESAVAEQRLWLAEAVDVDTERLLAATRAAIKAIGEPRPVTAVAGSGSTAAGWTRLVWAGAGALALVLAVAGIVATSGGVRPVLVTLGVEKPPQELVHQADMFRDYDIIRELELLEYFEELESRPGDDERASGLRRYIG